MDTIVKWWRRYIGGGNINNTLQDVHAQYGKLEYLLPALYLLYCLVLMQFIAKSFEAAAGFKRALVVFAKLLFLHLGLALAALVIVSQFSYSLAAQLLEHFLKNQLPFGFIGLIIPICCMLLVFVLGMFKKLLSKRS